MIARNGRVLLGVALGLSSLLLSLAPVRAGTNPPAGMQVSLRPGGLDLDWQMDAPTIQNGPDGILQFSLDGCVSQDVAGGPVVPVCRRLVALPNGADPEILVSSVDEEALPIPDGGWIPIYQPAIFLPDGTETFPPVHAFVDDFTPSPIQLERLGRVSGVDLARLTFYPLQIRAEKLVETRRVRATVDFHAAEGPAPTVSAAQTGPTPLSDAVDAMLLNPGQVEPLSPTQASIQAAPQTDGGSPRAAIEVAQPGITALTYAALKSAGFPVDQVDPHHLHLTRAGNDISIEWVGNDNTSFEPGERLLFYAGPRFNRYANTDVYFLSASTAPWQLMSGQDANPEGLPAGVALVHQAFEQNRLYTPDCNCAPIPAGRDGDRWVWDELRLPDRVAATYTFNLPDLAPGGAGQLTVWLIGYTDLPAAQDHRIQAAVNGKPVGETTFNGKAAVSAVLNLGPGVLQAGDNLLTLTLPGIPGVSVEGAWLDAFAVDYPRTAGPVGQQAVFSGSPQAGQSYSVGLASAVGLRVYDVSAADHPARLTDWKAIGSAVQIGDPAGSSTPHTFALAAESGLLAPAQVRLAAPLQAASGADELMIAPAALVPGLADLVSLRQGQGLSVAIQDVQGIYDNFGDGRSGPEAIHDYLAWVYASWNPRPAYVLLVGDGTSDPKRYRTSSSATLIPPYLADVDPLAGETAADNRYTAVDGADELPDFLLGRLPVNSPAELAAVVQKLVHSEQSPAPGAWRQAVTFIADNPDEAGDFQAEADGWIQAGVHAPQTATRLYYNPAAKNDAGFHQNVLQAWQAGGQVFVYHGHSSIHQWGVERFFHLDDVAGLRNASRLPVLLEMTCLTGSFQVPDLPTLDESLVRAPDGGAVAAWSSTGFGYSASHSLLAGGFLNALPPGGKITLGAAALTGKLNLSAQASQGLDALDTFTLLGDPATIIHLDLPTLAPLYLPVIRR